MRPSRSPARYSAPRLIIAVGSRPESVLRRGYRPEGWHYPACRERAVLQARQHVFDQTLQIVLIVGKDETDAGQPLLRQAIEVVGDGLVRAGNVGNRHEGLDCEVLVASARKIHAGDARPFRDGGLVAVLDVKVALGERGLVGLLGDHGEQHIGPDTASEALGHLLQFRVKRSKILQANRLGRRES